MPTTPAPPDFAVDWFTEHQGVWERLLVGRFKGVDRVRALLVGAYEGRALLWLLEHVLIGQSTTATVLDDFQYPSCVSERSRPVWNPDVRARFVRNLAAYKGRVHVFDAAPPIQVLRSWGAQASLKDAFHIVYIDAHNSHHALEAAVLSFHHLAPGGVMVLQNYVHNKEHDARCPRRGIDGFLDAFAPYIKVLRNGFHLFLEKRTAPLPVLPCHSEHFEEPSRPLRCGAGGAKRKKQQQQQTKKKK